MTNIVATENSNTLPAQYIDPVEELANEARNNFDNRLAFVKGKWLLNDDKVSAGTEYVAHVDQLVRSWVRFEDNKPVERIIRKRNEGPLPERGDLSFADESEWPRDNKGKARNPWVKQFFVPMINTGDGALVTFVTPTVGGRIAVGKLCDAFLSNGRRRPIVTLDVGHFKSKEYDKVDAPVFKIVGFEENAAEIAPPEPVALPADTGKVAAPSKKKTPAPRKTIDEDMDDSIPF